MKCPRCQHENPPQARFCPECGTRLALVCAEQHGQHGFGARAHRILGDIARLHPSLLADSAESYYREALRRADERDMRPLAAHCHLGLGRLYRHSGKHDEARAYLTKVTNMYREINIQFWLQKTEV